MTTTKFFLVSLATLAITGCGSKLPECGDLEALNLVKKIISEDSEKKGAKIDVSQIVLEGVETKLKDDKLKKNQCQANLVVNFKPETAQILKDFNTPEIRRDLFVGAVAEGDVPPMRVETALSYYKNPAAYTKSGERSDISILEEMYIQEAAKGMMEMLNKGKVSIENDEKLRQLEKLSYVVRRNEDKSSGGDYYVEVDPPTSVMDLITMAAGIQLTVDKGRKEIVGDKAGAK